jgi:hypothetical protein
MNGFCEHALAGPALALQKNGRVVRFRRLACHFQDPAGGFIESNDFAEVVSSPREFHVVAHAHTQREHLGRPMQGRDHVRQMEGLNQVVVGAQLHRLHRPVDHVVGAHHQDNGGMIGLLHAAQHFNAIDSRQHDVEQRQIRLFFGEHLQRVLAGGRGEDVKPLLPQSTGNRAQRQFLVIDNQDGIGHRKSGSGL